MSTRTQMQLGVLCRCYPVGSQHQSKCHWGDRWSKYGKEGRGIRCWGLFCNNLYSVLFVSNENRLHGQLESLNLRGLIISRNKLTGGKDSTRRRKKKPCYTNTSRFIIKLPGSHNRRFSWWRSKVQINEWKMPEQMTFWETKHKNKRLKSMGVISQVHLKNLGQLGDDGEHIYFPKDPKCAETHVKEIESSVGSPQAFGILSEIPTRELGVDVEVIARWWSRKFLEKTWSRLMAWIESKVWARRSQTPFKVLKEQTEMEIWRFLSKLWTQVMMKKLDFKRIESNGKLHLWLLHFSFCSCSMFSVESCIQKPCRSHIVFCAVTK